MTTTNSSSESRKTVNPNRYVCDRAVGQGTFGTVRLARDTQTNMQVAIKSVLQDPCYKNRELQIMRMLSHPNIVKLLNYYYTKGEPKPDDVYLHLVMEYVPDTLQHFCRVNYYRQRQNMPMVYVKLFMFQLLRAIGYLNLPSVNVCHRDLKPHNVLVDPVTGVLKMCDFGSAKQLNPREPNIAYICSRYYRAPELIFGNQYYTPAIDTWSIGCIFAEIMCGVPIFRGSNSMGQLVEIIRVLGTPTKEQLQQLNSKEGTRLADIKPKPWSRVFGSNAPPEACDLASKLLEYIPSERLTPFNALVHPFFDELHNPKTKLPNGNPLPPLLFKFSEEEKAAMTPEQIEKLCKD